MKMIPDVAIKFLVQQLSTLSYQIAVGTGRNPAWREDKTLQNEVARADATVTIETTEIEGDTLSFEATFTFEERIEITEFGVFEKTTGTMMCRIVTNPVEIEASQQLICKIHIRGRRS